MRTFARYALNMVVVATLLLSAGQATPTRAQEDPEKFIAKLISQMTPEDKVGQLFIVAFPGLDTGAASEVGDLIVNYHIGGAVLSTANGNIVSSPDAPTQAAALTASLQNLVRSASNVPGAGGRVRPFIPLFIALEQSGNGPPHTQLTGGTTPLPSAMAIGATWKRDDAASVGKAVGTELAAVGVNLLVGPSLDVLDTPRPTSVEPGVGVFGGDPYWVGVVGQSYVRGLRAGSQGRVAAALTHFPGQGSAADADDVIDKSLEELKKVELAPFLSAMQPAAGEPRALADALMTSHLRYRGFLGNIRERTAPISVDARAMQALLTLPEAKAWRDAGGVLVSGSLGDLQLRRYYDPRGLTFPAAKVAQEALQAGNDVLVLSDFGVTGSWQEQLANVKNTIKSFQEKYSADLAFQARVDDAVARILRLKVRLYPGFDLASIAVNPAKVTETVGRSRYLTLQVAQDALTLLFPSPTTLTEKPLPVPALQDSILIFTDDRLYKECSTCPGRSLLATDAVSQTMTRLYPGRVDPARITDVSLGSLLTFLSGTLPISPTLDVGAALNAANWIVFGVLDTDAAVPHSMALKQLVAQRPNLLTGKKVVILAFDAPYHLEPEVIAKATAVYVLYGRTEPFIEVAVRALFGEVKPQGNPPVSVEAIRYNLITQTEPNPNQIIQIAVGEAPKDPSVTPAPVAIKVGDTLKLRTGVIVDRNGNPVPDGTQVTFTRTFSQNVELPSLVAPTRDGWATVSFVLDRIGPLRVRASSEPAMTSVTLQLTVGEQPSKVEFISPPTPTPVPTATNTPTPVPTPTVTPTPVIVVKSEAPPPRHIAWGDLLLAVAGVIVTGGAGYGMQRARKRSGEASADATARAIKWGLWSVLTGLAGYVLYGAGAPGSAVVRAALGAWAALTVVVVFGAVPVLVGFRNPNRR